jgi:hypothetical protein
MARTTKRAEPLGLELDQDRSERNGLKHNEEKLLRRRLQQCDAVLSRRGNLGGVEIRAVEKMRSELLARVDPETVESMERRAAELLEPMLANGQTFYWLQPALAEDATA